MNLSKKTILQQICQLDIPLQLLFLFLRKDHSCGDFLRSKSISRYNWTVFRNLSLRFGVLPLIYQRIIRDKLKGYFPPELLLDLKKKYIGNLTRNISLIHQLHKVYYAFQSNKIPVLLFKGPASSQLAYRDPALRTYSDIDLIIPPSHFKETVYLLKELDFTFALDWTPKMLAYINNTGRDFNASKNILHLDIHQQVAKGPKFLRLPDKIWERTRDLDIQNHTFQTFSLEDTVVFLSLHCAKDGWSSFKTLSDLGAIIESFGLQWDIIFKIASSSQSQLILKIALYFILEYFGVSLPADVRQRVYNCSLTQKYFHFFSQRLFNHNFSLDIITWYSTIPKCVDSKIARLHFYSWFLTHPSPTIHRGFFKLPYPFFFLYQFFAPFYMAYKYKSRIFNL